jgi:CheY-like chemotaxis protein
MFVPRIILVWEYAFLRDTIKALLEQAGLELTAVLEFPTSIEAIQKYAPSHILVATHNAERQKLITSLLEQEEVKVIRFSLDHNRLQIFQRQDYVITRPSDLLALL